MPHYKNPWYQGVYCNCDWQWMENSTGAATKSLYVQMSGCDTDHCSYFITVFNARKLQKCNKPHSSQLSNYIIITGYVTIQNLGITFCPGFS